MIPRQHLITVDQFTYLGIIFNYNYKFTKAKKNLSEQARKALFALKNNISDMSFNNETLLSLFDCLIGDIVNPGELTKGKIVEKLHLEFCKQKVYE